MPTWPRVGQIQRDLRVLDPTHLHGLRYFAITLAPYLGELVTIRYDPRDLAEIRVYHQGDFLCWAVAPEIAAATISMQGLTAATQPAATRTAAEADRAAQPGRTAHPTRRAAARIIRFRQG